MGRIRLQLVDVRSNSPITLEVDPETSIDELVRMLKEQGVVQPAEAVTFGKVRSDGTLEPLNPSTAGDLLALAARGVRVGFEARRIHGGEYDCLANLREVVERLRLKFEDEIAYGYFKWRGNDDATYMLFIYCPEVPGNPPVVVICPYPYYVRIYHRFEESHARSCCWERKIADNICCYWHIDPDEWVELVEEVENPIYHVLNSALQALELHRVWPVTA